MASPYSPDSYNKAQLAEIRRRAVARQREEQQAQRQVAREEQQAQRQAARAEQQAQRQMAQAEQQVQRQSARAEQQAIRQSAGMREQAQRRASALEQAQRQAMAQAARDQTRQTASRQSAQLRQERQLSDERKKRTQEEAQRVQEGKQRFADTVKGGKGDKGSRGEALRDVVSNSRVMLQDGKLQFMPLVKSLEGVFGELTGPIGLAAQGALLLDAGMRHAAAEARSFRLSQLESGGTQYEVALGETLGKALGLDGKDVAREARQFSERITSDPQAMAYANRYGIGDTPGAAGGKIDKMEGLLKFLDKLRGMSDAEATRAARATGTEDFLPLRDLSKNTYEYLKEAARENAQRFSPEKVQSAIDRQARDSISRQKFGNSIGGFFDTMRDGAGALGGTRISDRQRQPDAAQGQQQRATTATERNTEALNTVSTYLRTGMYGGGERARGALPGAIVGAGWATKQYIAQAHALGAFSL